ncbi:MAG: PLP-dependent lyase/thiolase [Kiritimatiellia bacterium]
MTAPLSPTTFDPELSRAFGLRIYLKPEIHSATGSYKDRLGPAAIAEALQAGATKVVVTSSGNQGLAIAHAARAAGIPCLVLATQHILPVYRDALRDLGADLQTVPDMPARTAALHEMIAAGWFPVSVAPEDRGQRTQPGKSGYAAIAREIVDALGAAPDFLILPVCFGDGCAGILLGFRQLARERGTAIPKFVMIRARSSEDVAFSITADATTPEVAATLEATRGVSMYFKNADFLEAQRLGREAGLDLEAAAAAPFLALRRYAADPGFPPGSVAVLLFTAKHRPGN